MSDAEIRGDEAEPDSAGSPTLDMGPGLDFGSEPPQSQNPSFDSPSPSPAAYRVLARKYRPASFDDLIGQDAMVRTLANAFESGRIPQAWILTGVRGVGKTTTARILARALNYAGPDVTGPSIRMPVLGEHCQAIMESRHVDVIEMDAASHNGVDDVRQINDAVRYAPSSARYKVYILDEVHMLSGPAFNALLKTLEEPPPHVKFLFATTEIRKVPITVLSRCQRFDLRRVESGALVAHLAGICAKEGVAAEPEALAIIARAAEGSVRDALSLLDQAIAHAAGPISAADLRQMLGLADRARIVDLFESLMRGDVAAALAELRTQYDQGADPAVALIDLADFTHFVTRIKVVPSVADDPAYAEAERRQGRALAAALSMRVLSRTWQMLLKGITEAQEAAKPLAAAEMVLVRIAYAADLPSPEDVIRTLTEAERSSPSLLSPTSPAPSGGGSRPRAETLRAEPMRSETMRSETMRAEPMRGGSQPALAQTQPVSATRAAVSPPIAAAAAPASAAEARVVGRFEDLVALAAEKRDLTVKNALESDVRLVGFADGVLEIALEPAASKTLLTELQRKLSTWTGRLWRVTHSREPGAPTLRAQAERRHRDLSLGVQTDPLVQAVLARFPGAEIVGVRARGDVEIEPAMGYVAGNGAASEGLAPAPDEIDEDGLDSLPIDQDEAERDSEI